MDAHASSKDKNGQEQKQPAELQPKPDPFFSSQSSPAVFFDNDIEKFARYLYDQFKVC